MYTDFVADLEAIMNALRILHVLESVERCKLHNKATSALRSAKRDLLKDWYV